MVVSIPYFTLFIPRKHSYFSQTSTSRSLSILFRSFVHSSICLCDCLSVYLSVYLYVCMYVCLSVCLSVCLPLVPLYNSCLFLLFAPWCADGTNEFSVSSRLLFLLLYSSCSSSLPSPASLPPFCSLSPSFLSIRIKLTHTILICYCTSRDPDPLHSFLLYLLLIFSSSSFDPHFLDPILLAPIFPTNRSASVYTRFPLVFMF